MEVFSCKFEDWNQIIISLNWCIILALFLLVVLIAFLIHKIKKHIHFKSIVFDEATIGIGNSSITIKYDGSIKEIAYKIWIELTTRKVGILFDETNDVIVEVYNSWYDAFKIIRTLLEEIPGNRLTDAEGLINVTTKVLNYGLRPHLTKWQARFRKWYKYELENDTLSSPQSIQQNYPEYQQIVEEIKATNLLMINYAKELKRLIDA